MFRTFRGGGVAASTTSYGAPQRLDLRVVLLREAELGLLSCRIIHPALEGISLCESVALAGETRLQLHATSVRDSRALRLVLGELREVDDHTNANAEWLLAQVRRIESTLVPVVNAAVEQRQSDSVLANKMVQIIELLEQLDARLTNAAR